MAEKTEERKQTLKEKNQSKIEDYLTGPPKKKKTYIVLALGPNFDQDLNHSLSQYVNRTYPQLSTSTPRTAEELTRQFNRDIVLLILNDEFDDPDLVIKMVRMLKEKRRRESIPVLFLTRNPKDLVDRYHKELMLYHESDEYIVYPGLARSRIFARIRLGVEQKNRRRSRRYQINLPIKYFLLSQNSWLEGTLRDLSIHGALLESGDQSVFRIGDQIKLQIPKGEQLSRQSGDFIKISARVRRVIISGIHAAISFEHVTDQQYKQITEFLTLLVDRQMKRQSARLKAFLEAQEQNS